MPKSREPLDRHKHPRLPHRVELPAKTDIGSLHAWALNRCGHGGYAVTGKPASGEVPGDLVVFHFLTAEVARDFAANFEKIGAKLVP